LGVRLLSANRLISGLGNARTYTIGRDQPPKVFSFNDYQGQAELLEQRGQIRQTCCAVCVSFEESGGEPLEWSVVRRPSRHGVKTG